MTRISLNVIVYNEEARLEECLADVDAETSLCLMTVCDAVVVANSSFSWWGAFLNPTADVYAPSRWFGPDMPPPNDRQDHVVASDPRAQPSGLRPRWWWRQRAATSASVAPLS